jgi:hypothetical protein
MVGDPELTRRNGNLGWLLRQRCVSASAAPSSGRRTYNTAVHDVLPIRLARVQVALQGGRRGGDVLETVVASCSIVDGVALVDLDEVVPDCVVVLATHHARKTQGALEAD